MAELPQILAGPILRRTDKTGAWVWIATSQEVAITATAYKAASTIAPATPAVVASGTATSVRFAKSLHVTLVGMKPTTPPELAAGELFAYNLELTPKLATGGSGTPFKLDTTKELKDEHRIAYPPYALPTFFIPKPASPVNLLHGSCRKAHGLGDDAFAGADVLLRDHVDNVGKRPSALFLTGDQIYGDDVHDTLAAAVDELGYGLLGFREMAPVGGSSRAIQTLANGERGELLADVFTPDNKRKPEKSSARNQLIGFGDYAAMHLLHWNLGAWAPKVGEANKDVKQFKRRLPEVRRALANIPTYMMLDDHEITDDWPRTKGWQAVAEASPLGRLIIANGLVAFWAFQAWGNVPDATRPDYVEVARNFMLADHEKFDVLSKGYVDAALKFRDFSFVAPTHPPAVVVDMRTTRGPDAGTRVDGKQPDPNAPCEVLGAAGLKGFLAKAKSVCVPKQDLLLVVAPPPVLGFAQWEIPQEFILPATGLFDADETDLESWHANPPSYHRFLIAIAEQVQPKACLFLSGDVHFGHITKAVLTPKPEPGKPPRQIGFTQFTASALKHRHFGYKIGLLNIAGRFVPDLEPEWVWKSKDPPATLPLPKVAVAREEDRTKTFAANGGVPDYTHRSYGVGATKCAAAPLLVTDSNIGLLTMASSAPDALARLAFLGPDAEELASRELYLDWRPALRPRDQ